MYYGGQPFAGVHDEGTMGNGNSVGCIEMTSRASLGITISSTVHELGHGLGMNHDTAGICIDTSLFL